VRIESQSCLQSVDLQTISIVQFAAEEEPPRFFFRATLNLIKNRSDGALV
jgi:hypothetical protein